MKKKCNLTINMALVFWMMTWMISLMLAASAFAATSSVPVYDLSLPMSPVSMKVKVNEYDYCNKVANHSGLLNSTLFNVPDGSDITDNGVYNGYCVDLTGAILDYGYFGGATYTVDLYSSTDPNRPSHLRGTLWNKINYILNLELVNEIQPTWLDKQAAIWSILYGCEFDANGYFTCTPVRDWPFPGGLNNAGCANVVNQTTVEAIRQAVDSGGYDQFIPEPGQKMAVILDPQTCLPQSSCEPYGPMQLTFIELTPACTRSIGDFVWHDLDHNGIQDAGEPGIDGVTVYLEDSAGNIIARAITGIGPMNQHGYYQFTALCDTAYTVEVDETTLPAGLFPAISGALGSDYTNDSNGSPSPVSFAQNSSSDPTIDFGYISPWTGKIGDFVWNDVNHDGLQDADEPGIDGVKVDLKDADTGSVLATTITGAGPNSQHGYYQFTGLSAGSYVVEVEPPTGYVPTMPSVGTDDTIDSTGSPVIVTLDEDNSVDQTIDFGFKSPWTGKIGDFVWHDLNHDGLQDDGEPGIDGATVTLKRGDNGAVLATTTTRIGPAEQHGYYEFTGLGAGAYIVEVTAPTGYTPTAALEGADTGIDSNGTPALVTLPDYDSVDETVDFGFETACTGKIGDFVWKDLNHNGVQDVCRLRHIHHCGCKLLAEPGIDGVTVNLKDAETGKVLATTTTGIGTYDRHGYYQFTGLCAGAYTVEAVTPTGFTPTTALVGDDDTIDSNGSPANVSLFDDNAVDETIDFGFVKVCAPGTGTPGYWKNHPKAWPVSIIDVGGTTYSKSDAILLMSRPTWCDVTYIMFRELVAAKLNVLVGNDASCISGTIDAADAWMAAHPIGSGVRASSLAWDEGEPLAAKLDKYNNGRLCERSRDRR